MLVGAVCLVGALVSLIGPTITWLPIPLSIAATYGLAADRRFGWIGGGLVVLVATPYGRGADVAPFLMGDLPIRPHDGAIATALIGVVLSGRLRRPTLNGFSVAIMGWLLLGVSAVLVGFVMGNEVRDVLRDARWWGLYGVGLVAMMGGTTRTQIVWGLLAGASVLAVLVVVATVLPAFDGGLKAAILAYDRGTLRMQFGNSVLLLVATGYVASKALRAPSISSLAWLGVLLVAQVLSLTRISLIVTGIVLALIVLEFVRTRTRHSAAARPAALLGLVVGCAFVVGIGLNILGIITASSLSDGTGENAVGRIFFGDERSDIDSIVSSVGSGGRLATYRNAINAIKTSPIVGRGFGSLVDVPFAYNTDRAYTVGKQPGVDNAYLTAALKGGLPAAAVMAAILLVPLRAALRTRPLRAWLAPAWIGVVAMTITQSFAVSSYGPFTLALLASVPFLGYTASKVSAARLQE